MAEIRAERFTDDHHGPVVVFLIGMRVNRWRRVRQWWPVAAAMPRMLRELYADPASGFLGHRGALTKDGPLMVQYWASREQLLAYAADPAREHRPAWRDFNTAARQAGAAVGIWHETYVVPDGGHESIYSGMPVVGLARATAHVPVARRGASAAERLAATRSG